MKQAANLRRARLRLAVLYSVALCAVTVVIVGVVYVAVASTLDTDPVTTKTVVSTSPATSGEVFEEITTSAFADIEVLVNRRALDQLRNASLVALGGLFVASLMIGWIVAGRVLAPIAAGIESQRRFVHDASHELRNPLAVMRATLDLAMEEPSTTAAEWRDTGRTLAAAADRMAAVVDQLLVNARGEVPALRVGRFDPADSLRRLGDQCRATAALAAVSLDVDAEHASLAGDERAIERLVGNLVDNALRIAPRQSTVTIEGRLQPERYEIRVRDTGPGLDLTAPIFERGHRGVDSTGMGLGLAIARDIARGHGGEVEVESTSPHGTTMLVRLPIRDVAT